MPTPQDANTRLPFDLYARYRMVADAVDATGIPRPASVLDVGGGPANAAAFMPADHVTVSDVRPPDRDWYSVPDGLIVADGAKLPFRDRSYDAVVSCDTLEHVPREQRDPLLRELVRVSRGWVVLACPCNTKGVAEADQAVLDQLLARFGEDFPSVPVLREHLGYGHPDPDATVATLREAGCEVAVAPSGCLDRWMPMTTLFYALMELGRDEAVEGVQAWYNDRFTLADRSEPAYRRVFVARRSDAAGPAPDDVVSALLAGADTRVASEGLDVLAAGLAAIADEQRAAVRRRAEAAEAAVQVQAQRAEAAQRASTAAAQRCTELEQHVVTLLEERAQLVAFRDRVTSLPGWKLLWRMRGGR